MKLRHPRPNPSQSNSDLIHLRKRILDATPPRGYTPPLHQKVAFRSLPLSEATLLGLEGRPPQRGNQRSSNNNSNNSNNSNSNNNNNTNKNVTDDQPQFRIMTDIQNACIPHALAGRDILGAARTGSGKTLAFLLPTLELLHHQRTTPADGPTAILLSPTRELAIQTFQVLRHVGSRHVFSAGLIVGGKKEFGVEMENVGRMNILVGTPGRLLMHLERTVGLDVGGVRVLVLDEADRILDMGFRDQMIKILEYLPPGNNPNNQHRRQTMLFSATQTKRVADLAALSLHRPEYLGVHDKEDTQTPAGLLQTLVVVPLQHKLDTIFSFIKSHLRCKTIIFFSSCSQVRHVWELFCTLQPGVPLMALHGKLKQETRTKLYFDFLQRPHAVLFATDVASRGLDFPKVDWVVQADAPENVDMYIHRVGRTARYTSGGKALLVLLPQEEQGMKAILSKAKISIKTCNMNPQKAVVVSKKAAAVVASSPERILLAKKAFKSYLRSVHLMPDKEVFSVEGLPLEEYAQSLGLASMPPVRFLKKIRSREEERKKKNVDYKLQSLKEEIRAERLAKRIGALGTSGGVPLSKKRTRGEDSEEESDEEDGLLVVKQVHEWGDKLEELPHVRLGEASRSRHDKKIRIDGSSTGVNQKIVFNDEGEVEDDVVHVEDSAGSIASGLASAKDNYVQQVRERLGKTRDQDRKEEKDRIQEKHKKRRRKEKGGGGPANDDGDNDDVLVTLGGAEEDGGDDDSSDEGGEQELHEDDEEDEPVDVRRQEEMALAMLGS